LDRKLIYLLYRFIEWIGSPFILIYLAFRTARDRRYLRRFGERLGFLAHELDPPPGGIWVHAVSVGEVLAVERLLRRLKAEAPWLPLFVSTSTLAGRQLAEKRLADIAGAVFFAPLDYCFAVRRLLRRLRPSAVVVAETEIWPNLYREAKRAGCGLLIVNGRISDAALPRYLRLRGFFSHVLAHADLILAQSAIHRDRFLALGAPCQRTFDGGNLKYDFEPAQARLPAAVKSFLNRTRPEEIWIAASTMPPADSGDIDEDDAVIEAFKNLASSHPQLLLLLVPRKPERFDAAAEKLAAANVRFLRRSRLEDDACAIELPGVLLVDSIGELSSLFTLESIVFIGGSLARRGGHNILEPAFFGRAIITGPHMENFREIAEEFSQDGGLIIIETAGQLASTVDRLMRDKAEAARVGATARRLAETRRGATERALREIINLHAQSVTVALPPGPLKPFLRPAAWLWKAGVAWRRQREAKRKVRIATPVVSVGGLSMGGSGKTPFVLWLARRLAERGLRPAFLTRGYRRSSPEKITLLEPGAPAPVARTGDEAQILVRAAVAPVGIGRDRAVVARAMEERFHPDVFLLDDGFQHWRLARDLDIVLIDALDPLGGGGVFPLGRLREDLSALSRANILVITRAQPGRRLDGIISHLRIANPSAPIFRARVRPERWRDAASGESYDLGSLPIAKPAAFCGLANPATFWATLSELGYNPVLRRAFPDHHRYRPVELARLARQASAAGADALLTTEKDSMNLCPQFAATIKPLRLFYPEISLEIEDSEQLVNEVLSRVAAS